MAHPKVSIIVPLYNKAPYVTKALESIASQTYTDWECIIVNDGSTDNSLEIVASWLALNPSIISADSSKCNSIKQVPCPSIRLVHQENAGVSAARNHGISLSTGEYVCFLDADDWWTPTFLQEMVKLAEEYPEAGLYASNYIYYKPGKTRVGVKDSVIEDCRLKIEDSDTAYINYPNAYYENGGQVVWTGAVVINRLKIEDCRFENGDYFPRHIQLGEDFLLWARIAMKFPVAFLNKPLAYYNNDVPAKLRLTQNLHKPETHMLWHMDRIEEEGLRTEEGADWKRLLDWLRVSGLMAYWMSDKYHDAAAMELEKVDGDLPKEYMQPIWYLRFKQCVLRMGSFCKQKLIRLRNK